MLLESVRDLPLCYTHERVYTSVPLIRRENLYGVRRGHRPRRTAIDARRHLRLCHYPCHLHYTLPTQELPCYQNMHESQSTTPQEHVRQSLALDDEFLQQESVRYVLYISKVLILCTKYRSARSLNKNPYRSPGRILNRFSKDTGSMDELLSKNLTEGIQIFSVMIGILGVIVVINPWMLILIVIIVIIFWIGKTIYLNAAQKIKRLETAGKRIKKSIIYNSNIESEIYYKNSLLIQSSKKSRVDARERLSERTDDDP